jgi:hypothetical protein
MYQKIVVFLMISTIIMALFFSAKEPAELQAYFVSPISPLSTPTLPASSKPTHNDSPSATEILYDVYGIKPIDIQPGGAYYVPPEYRGMVFLNPEEVTALGLKFVDFVLIERRSHCAMANPKDLEEKQITYDTTLGILVRTAVVVEILKDNQPHICWGSP